MQHVAYWTDDYAADYAAALRAGYRVGHEGVTGNFGPFVYFDTESHPGTVVELSDVGGPKRALFKTIADAAESWDGTDPIRPFPAVEA